MANKLYEENDIQAIANAIRAKGQTGTMQVSQMAGKVEAISTKEDVEWHQCPEAVKLFLDEIEYADYLTIVWKPSFGEASGTISYSSDNVAVSVSALDAGRANVVGSEITRGTNVTHATITATKNGVTKTLKVRLDNNPEYSNSTVMSCVGRTYAPTYVVAGNSKPVGKTVDGVTYYNEVPNEETPFASDNVAGTLKPLDKLRWLNTQVTTGTYYLRGNNVRDLGGWECDGGTVKYGKIVRGGEINPADKSLMVGEVGIRTEVSLLPTSKQQYTESPWDIDYVANPTNTDFMYRTDISNPDIKTQWKLYLNTIFDSVSHSKPVFFHCGAGADKTGTIACILLGILGVSLSDIQKDFELTSFSHGTTIDGLAAIRDRYVYLPLFLDKLNAYPLKNGFEDNFQNRCVSFVLDCETTIEQINKFRNTVIDGTPTPIPTPIPPAPYTNLADPNGGDWYNNYRQSNSAHGIISASGEQTTNTFHVGNHDIVRVKGLNGTSALDVSLLYPTSGASTGAPSGGIIRDVWLYDSTTGILMWTVSHSDIETNPYMRVTFFTSGLVGTVDDIIITVNEEIV